MARKHTAGAFDIRNIIGTLLGIYGILLLFAGFFLSPGVDPDTDVHKQSIDNVWVGIVLIIVAVIFFLWTKFRPIEVPEDVPPAPARVK